MEVYKEDRKVLILAFQISLAIHLIFYILLKILPGIDVIHNLSIPVEIEIKREEKMQKKEVEISKYNSDSQVKQIQQSKEREVKQKESIQDHIQQQSTQVSPNTQTISRQDRPSEPSVIDESNLSLLSKINSSSPRHTSSSSSQTFVGEDLVKIDKTASGDALSRKVLYRPPPIKLESDAPQPSIRVKIFISPDGTVSKVSLINITSDQNLNRKVVDYLMKWRFNPIQEDIVQYAVITIYF